MTSGRRVYAELSSHVEAAETHLRAIDRELNRALAEHSAAEGERALRFRELAQVRLEELAAKRIAVGLDHVDELVTSLLDQRRTMLETVEEALERSSERIEALKLRRDQGVLPRDEAAAEIDRLRTDVRSRMATMQGTSELQIEVERRREQAKVASARVAQADLDRQAKGIPYERDRLFMYLWKRRYRFPEYRARNLFRALDGWVARLCRYEDAHRNYLMLTDLPVRLRKHAEGLKELAQTAETALNGAYEQELKNSGMERLLASLEAAEKVLHGHELALDAAEAERAKLWNEHTEFSSGKDPATRQALTALVSHLESEDLRTLRADARMSPTPKDDLLVTTIEGLDQRRKELAASLEDLRAQQERRLAAARDLEDLRRRFRHEGFDSSHSEFDATLSLPNVLGSLLRGGAVLSEVWRLMARHHRLRMPPIRFPTQPNLPHFPGQFPSGGHDQGSSMPFPNIDFGGGGGGGGGGSSGSSSGGNEGFSTGGSF